MNVAIVIENQTNTKTLVKNLLKGNFPSLEWLSQTKTGVFSTAEIEKYIEEEELHEIKHLTAHTTQSLQSMSSGERKKALLQYLLTSDYDCLLLVNPYDNLDQKTQTELKSRFDGLSPKIRLVTIATRISDINPNTTAFYSYREGQLIQHNQKDSLKTAHTVNPPMEGNIPPPLKENPFHSDVLVAFNNVSVSFDGRQVLQNICWSIKKGEFWQLKGPNGSGKSTLLNMITGDSHKGYGQDLTLFGHKKGSGESVWDIKECIGYFTPAMVDRFRAYHSLENMLISGLHDSVGLYQKPTETEKNLALKWLRILELAHKKEMYFHQLSQGEKRLVMTARAMIKHPALLILDEPTVGLDDASAKFFVALVNKFASESQSAMVFVSHRDEKGLEPKQVFQLIPKQNGSEGKIHYF